MKDCGSCLHFTKWKHDRIGGGLCEFYDARTKTSYGKKCSDWKGIKYNRNKVNIKIQKFF